MVPTPRPRTGAGVPSKSAAGGPHVQRALGHLLQFRTGGHGEHLPGITTGQQVTFLPRPLPHQLLSFPVPPSRHRCFPLHPQEEPSALSSGTEQQESPGAGGGPGLPPAPAPNPEPALTDTYCRGGASVERTARVTNAPHPTPAPEREADLAPPLGPAQETRLAAAPETEPLHP